MSDVIEKYRDFGSSISDYLLSIGFEPLYVISIFLIVLTLGHWKYFKRWDELSIGQQRALKAQVFATIVVVIVSVIYFFSSF